MSYDKEVLTFSRRGLATTQHLRHREEPQPRRLMDVNQWCLIPCGFLNAASISIPVNVQQVHDKAACIALTLGAVAHARPLHLLCQHLKDLRRLASSLTIILNQSHIPCLPHLDVTYSGKTGFNSTDMVHHEIRFGQCQLQLAAMPSLLSPNPFRDSVITAAVLTSNASVLCCCGFRVSTHKVVAWRVIRRDVLAYPNTALCSTPRIDPSD